MRSIRRRAVRLAGALLMVALLVVPILASAHTHRDLRAVRSCATCVAAHHSPAIVSPPSTAVATVVPTIELPSFSRVVQVQSHRSPQVGRAPPTPAPVSVA